MTLDEQFSAPLVFAQPLIVATPGAANSVAAKASSAPNSPNFKALAGSPCTPYLIIALYILQYSFV